MKICFEAPFSIFEFCSNFSTFLFLHEPLICTSEKFKKFVKNYKGDRKIVLSAGRPREMTVASASTLIKTAKTLNIQIVAPRRIDLTKSENIKDFLKLQDLEVFYTPYDKPLKSPYKQDKWLIELTKTLDLYPFISTVVVHGTDEQIIRQLDLLENIDIRIHTNTITKDLLLLRRSVDSLSTSAPVWDGLCYTRWKKNLRSDLKINEKKKRFHIRSTVPWFIDRDSQNILWITHRFPIPLSGVEDSILHNIATVLRYLG